MSVKGFQLNAFVVAALLWPALSATAQEPGLTAEPTPIDETPTIPADAPAAPEATASAVAEKGQNRMVEEIVVTANRREENVQDIPQSVTAFSNDKLEAIGIQTVQDLPNITPGLTITNQAGFNQVFLRGVGTDAFLPGADASVPFYLDGIPLLSTQGSSDSLGKIQRVEVLKGPQGTLFGANSIGGAINIVTPDPTNTFEGDVQVGFGNVDTRKGAAYFNIPIFTGLAASVAAYGMGQDNFYVNDSETGKVIDVYNYGGRVKLLWDITEDLDNALSASYNKLSNNSGLIFENTLPAPRVNGVSPIPADPKADRHVDYLNYWVGARLHSWLISDTVRWTFPWLDFKAIGSYQDLVPEDVRATFGAGAMALAQQEGKNRQYTGEIQFLSNADTAFSDRLTWVGGFYYSHSVGGLDPFRFILAPGVVNALAGINSPLITGLNALLSNVTDPLLGLDLNEGIVLYNRGVIVAESSSVYFQGTYAFTDNFSFILGGRYQHTTKELTKSSTGYADANAPDGEIIFVQDDLPTIKSNQFSHRVGLQYRLSDDTQTYASWARGYKTPTYNTVNLLGSTIEPIEAVKAQRNDAFEIGLKTDLPEFNARVNSAIFYTKEKDLLTGTVQVLSGGIVNYDNAPKARIYGAETEIVWTPMPSLDPGLAINLSGAYLDTKYTKYPNGRGYDPETGLSYGPGTVLPLLPERDQTGNRIPRTPKWTGNVAVGQVFTMDSGSLEFSVDANYNSGFYWSAQNASIEKTFSYHLVNGHVTYAYDRWDAEIELFVKNATDEDYIQTVFVDDFGRSVILNDPRTYGFRVKWSF